MVSQGALQRAYHRLRLPRHTPDLALVSSADAAALNTCASAASTPAWSHHGTPNDTWAPRCCSGCQVCPTEAANCHFNTVANPPSAMVPAYDRPSARATENTGRRTTRPCERRSCSRRPSQRRRNLCQQPAADWLTRRRRRRPGQSQVVAQRRRRCRGAAGWQRRAASRAPDRAARPGGEGVDCGWGQQARCMIVVRFAGAVQMAASVGVEPVAWGLVTDFCLCQLIALHLHCSQAPSRRPPRSRAACSWPWLLSSRSANSAKPDRSAKQVK